MVFNLVVGMNHMGKIRNPRNTVKVGFLGCGVDEKCLAEGIVQVICLYISVMALDH